MAEERFNGLEDTVIMEMIKRREGLRDHGMFPSQLHQSGRCSMRLGIVKWVFLRTPDAAPRKGIRSYRTVALASVTSKWHATWILPRLEKKRLEGWKQLHVEGVDGIGGPREQVVLTQQRQRHWAWQEDRRNDKWQGGAKCQIASMDIKTAFNVAGPKNVATGYAWGSQQLSRDVGSLEGPATFEKLRASSKSRDASAKAVSKHPRFGSSWPNTWYGYRRKAERRNSWQGSW